MIDMTGVEKWLDLTLTRSRGGVLLEAKAWPVVEEFFKQRSVGLGTTSFDNAKGKFWCPSDHKAPPDFYSVREELGGTGEYSYMSQGLPMLYDGTPNLTFLRSVGISEGSGIAFTITTPMSVEGMRSLKKEMSRGFSAFCHDHLVPATFRLVIISNPGQMITID